MYHFLDGEVGRAQMPVSVVLSACICSSSCCNLSSRARVNECLEASFSCHQGMSLDAEDPDPPAHAGNQARSRFLLVPVAYAVLVPCGLLRAAVSYCTYTVYTCTGSCYRYTRVVYLFYPRNVGQRKFTQKGQGITRKNLPGWNGAESQILVKWVYFRGVSLYKTLTIRHLVVILSHLRKIILTECPNLVRVG